MTVIGSPEKKYQYHVLTWGGFYNHEYKNIHGLDKGDFFFDTKEERDEFIRGRFYIAEDLNAGVLCFSQSEGFCCDTRTVLHRITEIEGKQYYSTRDMGINYPYSAAHFFMENKWQPGFNDYPIGEDYDYTDAKIIQQWITGAFSVSEED